MRKVKGKLFAVAFKSEVLQWIHAHSNTKQCSNQVYDNTDILILYKPLSPNSKAF